MGHEQDLADAEAGGIGHSVSTSTNTTVLVRG
jgi:hypothetical protein